MADLNEVRLIGRLTRDPELRSTPGGQSICNFGLATSHKWTSQDGEKREDTTFVDVTAWAKTAENVAKYMHKGSQIFIGGRLKFESWEDKATGQKRSKLSVTADNVQFLDSKPRDESQPQPQPAQRQRQTPPPAVTAGWGGDEPDMGEPPF